MASIKRKKYIYIIIVVLLLIIGTVIVYSKVNKEDVEITKAKDFISMLMDEDMLQKGDIDDVNFACEKNIINEKEFYKVTSDEYGLDMDSNYNIIGFSYKLKGSGNKFISSEEAQKIAAEDIAKLTEEDYMFKEVEKNDSSSANYIFDFNRYSGGYPFFDDKIVIMINKYTGKLSGYTNTSSQREAPKVDIVVDQKKAESIVDVDFLSNNNDVSVIHNDTYQAFYEDKTSKVIELCHIVTVEGVNSDNKEVRVKYVVSTESGKIVTIIKDNVKDNSKNATLQK